MLGSTTSLNDLIGPREHCCRDRKPKSLRGLEVDQELELRDLLYGEVGRPHTAENLVHVDGGAAPGVRRVVVVAHQTPGFHEMPSLNQGRQPVRNGQLGDALSLGDEGWGAEHEHRLRAASGHSREGAFQLGSLCSNWLEL